MMRPATLYQARWRAKNPHYGLWLALRAQAGRAREELHLTQLQVKDFWSKTPHQCAACGKPCEFKFGAGPRSRNRQPKITKRDPLGLWVIDNLRVLCARCFRDE